MCFCAHPVAMVTPTLTPPKYRQQRASDAKRARKSARMTAALKGISHIVKSLSP
jgi:hypothetical protein